MPSSDSLSFLDFFAQLPTGGIKGKGNEIFGPAHMPEPFVAPTLRQMACADDAGLTFVSARGATGKSFFAERVSAMKAAPLWRLDHDRAVSGDALSAKLSGYLGHSRAAAIADDGDALILIDALDEARMRVSGVSWNDFLQSLIPYASHRRLMLFGRERVVEDLWLYFEDVGVGCDWFEIAYFDRRQRVDYVDRRVEARGTQPTGDAYLAARDGVLAALAGTIDPELADAFVGYAPVLDAVVALLADTNWMVVQNTFVDSVLPADRVSVLVQILESLLKREQGKVVPLAAELKLEPGETYSPSEQLEWLASDLLGAPPPALEWCDSDLRSDYAERIRESLRDHPFRAEDDWASPVFSAYVAAKRFADPRLGEALQIVGRRTGLLFDFVTGDGLDDLVDEWQFAALHASMLAAEWQAVEAAVAIETPDTSGPLDGARGELALLEGDAIRRAEFTLALETTDRLNVYGPTAFLAIDFPRTVVLRSPTGALALGPDCFVRCGNPDVGRRVDGDSPA